MSDFDPVIDRPSAPRRIAAGLRGVNRAIGLVGGVVLLLAGLLIIAEIVMRNVAFGVLGGTDEISGYVMAALASWGGAYALIEKAHIRIDLAHRRLPRPLQTLLDAASLGGLLAVSVTIAYFGYARVLSRSLEREPTPTANTPLETPLWIPQSVWFAGWCWFALAALILLALTLWAAALRDWAGAAEIAGPEAEEATVGADDAEAAER